jgi:hypothetical protein
MPATRGFGTVIAERRLAVRDTRKIVRVSIGAPRPESNGAPWACPFRIAGAGISRVGHGFGEDSMQALTDALEGIRHWLDESRLSLGWDLGDGAVWNGETGFARPVPIGFGAAYARRVGRLMDRELEREVRKLKSRPARRGRKAATAR